LPERAGANPVVAALLGLAALVTLAAVAAPLLVYSITLATFGLAHVLSELRYVDRRFGRRIAPARIAAMATLLASAAAARACGVFGLVDPANAVAAELSFVIVLALTAAHGSLARCAFAVTVAAGLGVATLLAPYDTTITLSVLHNLTPLAFLWEITPRPSRLRVMMAALTVFVALPLLVATGWPRVLMTSFDVLPATLDPLLAGPLSAHFYVYTPAPLLRYASAIDLFSASVVAQCAHYVAVIVVLPTLLQRRDPSAAGLLPWPRGMVFAMIVTVASAVALQRFAGDFVETRALYGIAASVHAWIEIPLIVIALTAPYASAARTRPNANDAVLVASDSNNARTGDNVMTQTKMPASARTTAASPSATAGT
jgi:hypothetical protein